ncbi:pantothenate kinase [Calothrix sp. 336/3]|uniref:pantothenate kinase n=1 Tax=Calothrix sp. 336/3 TaxID=1337936 RepID=UPI00055425E9|nr:pantothenate kinase [Calothrix sp. 336/3]AKG22530.1 pantothenate kinase [Calothrix sp. 336/3]
MNNGFYRIGLMIGNSRLHWGLFQAQAVIFSWDTEYLPESVIQQITSGRVSIPNFPAHLSDIFATSQFSLPIILASVVPQQTALWEKFPNVNLITLNQIPIQDVYPTLGIDRALAIYGANKVYNLPVLVIDTGTALTFTGVDNHMNFQGGAILPGLGLQLSTLTNHTGQLPQLEINSLPSLPLRYARDTHSAMYSGVIYTVLAGIKEFITSWWQDFPNSQVIITGGDRTRIYHYLQSLYPEIALHVKVEKDLIFWGMAFLEDNYISSTPKE